MTNLVNLNEVIDKIDYNYYTRLTSDIVKIDPVNIDGELVSQSLNYSLYSGLLAFCKKEVDRAKLLLDKYIGEQKVNILKDKDSYNVRVTNEFIDGLIKSQENFTIYSNKIIDLEYKFNLIRNLVEALKMRADMLVQMSANRRSELKTI